MIFYYFTISDIFAIKMIRLMLEQLQALHMLDIS